MDIRKENGPRAASGAATAGRDMVRLTSKPIIYGLESSSLFIEIQRDVHSVTGRVHVRLRAGGLQVVEYAVLLYAH